MNTESIDHRGYWLQFQTDAQRGWFSGFFLHNFAVKPPNEPEALRLAAHHREFGNQMNAQAQVACMFHWHHSQPAANDAQRGNTA